MSTALDLITDALVSLGELSQGETPNAEDGAFCLTRLNAMLDSFSTQRLNLYSVSKFTGALVANTQDYTIGPSGATFTNARPLLVQTATIVLPNTITEPMRILTSKEWAEIKEKALTGVLPDKLYFEPSYPNGTLHVHPRPSGTPTLELYYWTVLSTFANLSATFTFPPGYYHAIMWNLCVEISPGYNKPLDPVTQMRAQQGLSAIQNLNAQILTGSQPGEAASLQGPNIGFPQAPALSSPNAQ